MSVVYMEKLELEPKSFDNKFSRLTKGINLQVNELILQRIGSNKSILEVGCGTGTLAIQLAKNNNDVIAIDKNLKMIAVAREKSKGNLIENLKFKACTLEKLAIPEGCQDYVISNFVLSELRPLEQQIFLRKVWKILKPNGSLIITGEFVPKGIWKLFFLLRRYVYKKKMKRKRLPKVSLRNKFFNYFEQIGFELVFIKKWKYGAIQLLEIKKKTNTY